ncbi:MAG: hypothetical protein AAFY41_16245, partial [Bacteroidota bacterium]
NSRITLIADEIFLGKKDSIQGDGILGLQPQSDNVGIIVGGISEESDQLNLGTRDLEAFADGFSNILIGGFDQEPRNITIGIAGDAVFQDPLTLQANSIEITETVKANFFRNSDETQIINQTILNDSPTILGVDNASITINTENNIVVPNIIAPGQDVKLNSENGTIQITGRSILAPPIDARQSSITIHGNSLQMLDSTIDAINFENTESNPTVSIDIDVDNSVTLTNSSILSLTNGEARGGDVNIKAGGEVSLTGLSRIGTISLSNASGDSGDIKIEANSLRLQEGGQLSSSTFSSGRAGNIDIDIVNNGSVKIVGIEPGQIEPSSLFVFYEGIDPQNLNQVPLLPFPREPEEDLTNNVNFSDVIPHISQEIPIYTNINSSDIILNATQE